jgi:hypothetical protein
MAKPQSTRPTPAADVDIKDAKNAAPFTPRELVLTQNEWMRRYVEEPERFESEFKVVQLFLAESHVGKEPSYGEECTAYLQLLRSQLRTEGRL